MDKDKENPMEKILEQMQKENFSHAPGEGMTHVAGVSFVDRLGMSLGAAPPEEAGHAGAYRHIANCANSLEALLLEEEDSQEQERLERERLDGVQGQAQQGHDDYSSSGRDARSSTRLRSDDRHIVIERNPDNHNQVAVVVLQKMPEHDSEEAGEEGEDSSS